ncbi:replication family protein, partial [Staphylococcus aureus subsp. aureus CIG1150]
KKENYITQEEWVNLWQRALQVDYRPVANIKAIKPNKKAIKILNLQSKRPQNIRLNHLIF